MATGIEVMSSTGRLGDDGERLHAIMDVIAESIADASDVVLLQEAKEAGRDPAQTRAHVHQLLRNAVSAFKQNKENKMHPSNKVTLENVKEVFTFQNDPARVPKYVAIRESAMAFTVMILNYAPDCADRSAAIRLVREAVMNANAAIALEPLE